MSRREVKDLRELPIVEMVWDDAAVKGRWNTLKYYHETACIVECRAVGYLSKKTSREVQLLMQISNKEGDVSDSLTVPASCVKRLRVLKKGRKQR